MKKEELEIYTNDMKFKLSEIEEERFLKDFEEFKINLEKLNKINTENIDILVSPIYDKKTIYLREDEEEVDSDSKDLKEILEKNENFKDGFYTIPKVVN